MIDKFHNETNFPHQPLLASISLPNLCKPFANYLSTDIKLLKTQVSKIIKPGWLLNKLFCLF